MKIKDDEMIIKKREYYNLLIENAKLKEQASPFHNFSINEIRQILGFSKLGPEEEKPTQEEVNEYTNKFMEAWNPVKKQFGKLFDELLKIKNDLEEENKIPEKLTDILRVNDLIPPVDENMYKIWTQTIKNQNKLNEIIDYLKSKGE